MSTRTGPRRDARTTSCSFSSAAATADPMIPLAPITTILMSGRLHPMLATVFQQFPVRPHVPGRFRKIKRAL
ncbi:hypothetical protein ACQP1W_00090 [Spirillospora sp. CA-255316]